MRGGCGRGLGNWPKDDGHNNDGRMMKRGNNKIEEEMERVESAVKKLVGGMKIIEGTGMGL